jgi:hypothetical protein
VFFIGYIIFEIPSNILIKRAGAANWIATITVAWGVVTIGQGFVDSWELFLGTSEAVRIFSVFINGPNNVLNNNRDYIRASCTSSHAGTHVMKSKNGW